MKSLKDELNIAVNTGEIVLGSKNVTSALLSSTLKLVILSSDCQINTRERIIYYSRMAGIPYHMVGNNRHELGSMCGNPFSVSAIAVVNAGESGILELAAKR